MFCLLSLEWNGVVLKVVLESSVRFMRQVGFVCESVLKLSDNVDLWSRESSTCLTMFYEFFKETNEPSSSFTVPHKRWPSTIILMAKLNLSENK